MSHVKFFENVKETKHVYLGILLIVNCMHV